MPERLHLYTIPPHRAFADALAIGLVRRFGSDPLKLAVVGGAVAGGGMTVIANAPNPAGQALLARFFGGSVSPLGLAAAAIGPTIVAIVVFHVL